MGDENIHKVEIEIPFPSKRLAEIAYDVLRVDSEPKRSRVLKKLSVSENILKVNFSSGIAKQLRVAIDGLFESVKSISHTAEFLGEPVSDKYDHY